MYTNDTAASCKQMNYYVPITDKNSLDDGANVPAPRHAARILGRKYALTATSYKYLEIGISVGSVPTVEIIIGDNRGNQLILPQKTWSELMGKRVDIQRFLQAEKNPSSSPYWIRDLSIEIGKLRNIPIIKLGLSTNYMYLKPVTMNMLFNYEHCIDHMYAWLSENIHLVSLKFRNFVKILREKNITEMYRAAKAVRESNVFDCESLIDCELLASALKDIIYEAVDNKIMV